MKLSSVSAQFFNRATSTLVLSLSLFSSVAFAAPLTPDNAAWNVNRNPQLNPQAYFGEWPGKVYNPSPVDWRKVSIYQFITDRFGDGLPENNDGKYGGYDIGNVGGRHGGDFKGIIKRLDYVKSLGYNAIWVSPVFQNRFNSYHGYSQIDFTVLDDRFGTLDEFREMVAEAHKRGMYVLVDMVVNHLSDMYYFDGFRGKSTPFRMHAGEYKMFPHNTNETYTDFGVDNTFVSTGTYGDVYGADGFKKTDTFGQGSFWFSDFHHNGDLGNYNNDFENHLGKIYGSMDDLRNDNPRVQDKIIAMTKSLIASTDIDGIRMDTPMQVPLSFFQRWSPAVKDYATSLGKNDFEIFGEFFVNRERAATMTGRGRSPDMWGKEQFIGSAPTLDGGINYAFFGWTQDAIRNQNNTSLGNIKDVFEADKLAYDFWNPSKNQWQFRHLHFYDNHDQWRLSTAVDGFKKTDLGSAIIALWPGIPVFYYGDEQGLQTSGTALDGWAREDMMTSSAWQNLPTTTGPNPANGDNFDMTNPHYLWVQKLMNIRRQYSSLQTCDNVVERWRQLNNSNGIYAFTRQCGTPDDWVFVVWNSWKDLVVAGGSIGTLMTGWSLGDRVVNLLNPTEEYTVGLNGSINQILVGGYEVKVFVKKSVVKPLDPVVDVIAPLHDQRVTSDRVVLVHFSEDMDLDSVRAAFRYDGQPVPPDQLQWDAQNKMMMYSAVVADGIHTVEILETAKSLAGRNLFGKFTSRFRRGNDNNVIANPQNNWDTTLVTITNAATGSAMINHKAVGAEKFRVKNENGNWSDWKPYQSNSDWNVGTNAVGKVVTVQYWADNSSAYFMNMKLTSGSTSSSSSSTAPVTVFHLRGTQNAWAEGDLFTAVSGSTTTFEICRNFTVGDAGGGPRFKVDPNGAWGDAFPITDVTAAGWTKVVVKNNPIGLVSSTSNLTANCGAITSSSTSSLAVSSSVVPSSSSKISSSVVASSSSLIASSSVVASSSSSKASSLSSSSTSVSTYHLRGTQNAWAEGDLFSPVAGSTTNFEICRNFTAGDAGGGPRFKVDPNGGWGDSFPATDVVANGWTKVVINGGAKTMVSTTVNLGANCGAVTSSSASSVVVSSSVAPSSSSKASSSSLIPSSSSVASSSSITPSSSSVTSSSVVASSSSSKVSSLSSSSTSVSTYHLRGTQNAWAEGDLFSPVAGSTTNFEICRNFAAGDAGGGPRFKVDPNGGWGDSFPATDVAANGWTKVVINGGAKTMVSTTVNLGSNCGAATSSSASSVAVSSAMASSASSKISSSSVAPSSSSTASSSTVVSSSSLIASSSVVASSVLSSSASSSATSSTAAIQIILKPTVTVLAGQSVFVVGNQTVLSNWNAAAGIPCVAGANSVWTCQGFTLPAGTTYQYKYIKRDAAGVAVWEGGANRSRIAPTVTTTYVDTWQ